MSHTWHVLSSRSLLWSYLGFVPGMLSSEEASLCSCFFSAAQDWEGPLCTPHLPGALPMVSVLTISPHHITPGQPPPSFSPAQPIHTLLQSPHSNYLTLTPWAME